MQRWIVRNTDDNPRVYASLRNTRGKALFLQPGEEDETFDDPKDVAFLFVRDATTQHSQYSWQSNTDP